MNKLRLVTPWQGRWLVLATICGAGALLGFHTASIYAQEHPVDLQRELATKIKGPFTLVAVGDLLPEHAVTQISDPEVQGTFKIVRNADAAFANMESNIADYLRYEGPIVRTTGPKDIAADVKAMGFDIVSRANNHTTEGGAEGMLETDRWLDQAGVVHAGDGRNLDEAREAKYFESAKGRIGLVSMYALSPAGGGSMDPATYKLGRAGGSPGLNPLHLTMYQLVTPEQLEELRKIQDSIYAHRTEQEYPVPAVPTNAPQNRLRLSPVGEWYKAGTPPGGLSYTMDPEDLRQNLRSIRNGKELSDLMIATIHTHEGDSSLVQNSLSEYPPDFLVELAHKSIENGADVFVGTGVHVLRGIEIYQGRPIFYGLSSFVFQLNQQTVPIERYKDPWTKADPYTTEMTDAEVLWRYWDAVGRMKQINMESVITESRYDGGRLLQVRLYPIDLKFDAPLSDRGIPHLASAETAQRILERLQKLSKPFGTIIKIEGNVGVISVASSVSQH
jgi:hypothetical protein